MCRDFNNIPAEKWVVRLSPIFRYYNNNLIGKQQSAILTKF